MPDFFVSDPEETQFNLKDKEGKVLATVDALDIIYAMHSARDSAYESGDTQNWFMYFDKNFYDLTKVRLSKAQAVVLLRQAEESFEKLKKSGSPELNQSDISEEPEASQNETTES
jgi:glycogen debranching enzyme